MPSIEKEPEIREVEYEEVSWPEWAAGRPRMGGFNYNVTMWVGL